MLFLRGTYPSSSFFFFFFFFQKKKKSNVLNSLYYWCVSSPYALFNFNWISYSVHFSQVLWFDHLFGVQLNQLMSWTILAPIFNQVSWYQTFFFFLWRLYNKFIFIIWKDWSLKSNYDYQLWLAIANRHEGEASDRLIGSQGLWQIPFGDSNP